ncbi:cytochrome b-c1 complex subunit 7-like [Dendronephthya gigantea]|uniref:cytochrome b-c1 complex subunit 7-like n=1 Tax=Dendronephthya gigantea TaxID=151771 RepID=UPI001069458F|nr:cytochrome b-c1 complex subunit 7-like [Dendronephthya gigantea]XP_028400983.1 cytochrome b-c1 complex subunit 7-like [Dendronephthya gigantea]
MAYISRRFASQLSSGQRMFNAFREWYVNACGYRQLGLRKDDLMNEEDTPELTEAVRRLPEEEQNLRLFRIKRALDLSMKHQLLPKEEWTKPEEDVEYLSPILDSVIEERKERERWNWK